MTKIDAFDVPKTISKTIEVALRYQLISLADIIAMTTEHGDDWHAWADDLCDVAHANAHSPAGCATHSAVVAAAEEFWMEQAAPVDAPFIKRIV